MIDLVDRIIDELDGQLKRHEFSMRETTRQISLLLKKGITKSNETDSPKFLVDLTPYKSPMSENDFIEMPRRLKRILVSNFSSVHFENIEILLNLDKSLINVFFREIFTQWPENLTYIQNLLSGKKNFEIDLPHFLMGRKLTEIVSDPASLRLLINSLEFDSLEDPVSFFEDCFSPVVSKNTFFGAYASGLCFLKFTLENKDDEICLTYLKAYEKTHGNQIEMSQGLNVDVSSIERFAPYVSALLHIWARHQKIDENWQKLERLVRPVSLGDPRLTEGSRRWKSVGDICPIEFEQFKVALNRIDIELFFEHIEMNPERKKFWGEFVPIMSTVQVLLTGSDYTSLKKRVGGNETLMHVVSRSKRLAGNSDYSILIIEIGDFFVAEGGDTGSACHIFSSESFHSTIARKINDPSGVLLSNYSELRQDWRTLVDNKILSREEHRIAHTMNWQRKAEELLGLRGILRSKQQESFSRNSTDKRSGNSRKVETSRLKSEPHRNLKNSIINDFLSGPVSRLSREKVVVAIAQNRTASLLSDSGFRVEDLRTTKRGLWVEDSLEFRSALKTLEAGGLNFELLSSQDNPFKKASWKLGS